MSATQLKSGNRSIGKGKFSEVNEGVCMRTPVAVRRVTIPDGTNAISQRCGIYRGCEILSTLSDAHIVRLYGILEHPGDTWSLSIASELCGASLYDILITQKQDISEATKLDYIYHIAKGCLYLHSQKVLHRDICLQNILLPASGGPEVKLIDFDHAIHEYNLGKKEQPGIGTVGYVAPEIYKQGKDMYSRRSDVFAFAMTVYYILYGHFVYENYSAVAYKESVKKRERPDVRAIVSHSDKVKRITTNIPSWWSGDISRRWDFKKIVQSLPAP